MSFGPMSTIPSSVSICKTDVIPYGIDMTAALPNGGSVTGVTTSLLDLNTNQHVTLSDAAVTSGNIVTQIVRGSALAPKHSYQLSVVFTAATNTVFTITTEIDCLF